MSLALEYLTYVSVYFIVSLFQAMIGFFAILRRLPLSRRKNMTSS
jgi:hypothetical protein